MPFLRTIALYVLPLTLVPFSDIPLCRTASAQAAQIMPGNLDPARDPATLVDPHHQPLTEEYIWTADDVTALRADRNRFPFHDQSLRTAPHYFRAQVELKQVPTKSTFYLAGPRSATLWINGRVAAHFTRDMDNPLGAHVFHTNVSHLLHPGTNHVAIEAVRGRGIINGNMNNTMVQQAYGEVLVAKLLDGTTDDAKPLLISDKTWKSTSGLTDKWTQPDFNDSSWKPVMSLGPIESNPDFFQWSADAGLYNWPGYMGVSPSLRTYALAASDISHIYAGTGSITNIDVLRTLSSTQNFAVTLPASSGSDESHILLDFGREIAGRLLVESASDSDSTLSIGYGESEGEALSNQQYLGINTLVVPAHGVARGPKSAFRYVYVRFLGAPGNVIRLKSLRAEGITYPVVYRGSFQSSDALLNRIWETAAHTVHLCMQDDIWDAPKRDRGRWIGDLDVESRTIEAAFGDPKPIEQTLARTAADSGNGSKHINGIPGYTALWITTLAQLYRTSGDDAFLQQQSAELHALLHLMEADIDAQHRFTNPHHRWLFVDWSPELYGFTTQTQVGTAMEYILAFQQAEPMLRALHDDAAADESKATANAMIQALRTDNPRDDFGPRWQINALAILSGSAENPADLWQRNLAHIKQDSSTDQIISPYQNYYLLSALAQTGHQSQALNWMKQYWEGMLTEGATSFWESYDLRWPKSNPHLSLQADGTSGYFVSLAHGWSSGPLPWIVVHILGVHPETPGFATVTIAPDLCGLQWASGQVPTPNGEIGVTLHASKDAMKVTVVLPKHITAKVILPAPSSEQPWIVNGKSISATKISSGKISIALSGDGTYEITTNETH
jgi:alpha-L-rhamnosidase